MRAKDFCLLSRPKCYLLSEGCGIGEHPNGLCIDRKVSGGR
ncbi:hypothetical protein CLV41_102226 [Roseibium marinum]|uniref:Uncharacterized protein n=1 Tax=Roseibium marinum TaxID=281252 RepID=A0A2S3UYM2_9HYPH|nr:hypothetical protein CLV41_102226 [Roseibium marinum]